MATIDEFALKNIGLWWRYGISRHCDEWKCFIIGRIFESEIILIPPSLKISESSSNGSYRNTDKIWWRYGISRSWDECIITVNICLVIVMAFQLNSMCFSTDNIYITYQHNVWPCLATIKEKANLIQGDEGHFVTSDPRDIYLRFQRYIKLDVHVPGLAFISNATFFNSSHNITGYDHRCM